MANTHASPAAPPAALQPAGFRIAAAPISWGICDVPGWGYQMPYDRVLDEMRQLGITASELGSAGFLPDSAEDAAEALRQAGITPVGTYLDLVLHEAGDEEWRTILADTIDYVRSVGADTIVLAALAAPHSYDGNPGLSEQQWSTLLANLDEAAAMAAASGVTLAAHPHLGTLILTPEDIDRVLEGCSVPLCVDTGHAFAGGNDVLELVRKAAKRIRHIHLKDVDRELTERMAAGEIGFLDAVAAGIFRPLGRGCLPVDEIFQLLKSLDFSDWVVLEQDVMLQEKPEEGAGPLLSVTQSLEVLTGVEKDQSEGAGSRP